MIDRSCVGTKNIGVRVTEEDFARLQTLAEAQGKPMGEWCRNVLLTAAEGEKPGGAAHILRSEIAFYVQAHLAKGGC